MSKPDGRMASTSHSDEAEFKNRNIKPKMQAKNYA